MTDEKKNVYLTMHKSFVRENIEYVNRETGETETFNQVTLPKGTVIDGKDVGGFRFSPLYVNPSRFKGADWRDVPLLADREVWLSRTSLDEKKEPMRDESGNVVKETIKVMPTQIKTALDEGRRAYIEEHKQSLDEKAAEAREGAEKLEHASAAPEHENVRG